MLHIFLDQQKQVFERLKNFRSYLNKNHWYLIGGTSLALQIGHRRSIDFDFVTKLPVDALALAEKLEKIFSPLRVTQKEKNTLTVRWQDVQFSFFGEITRPLLQPLVPYEHLKLLSIEDIGAMKVHTILGRHAMKDYFDLAYLMQFEGFTMKNLIHSFYKKYKDAKTQFSSGFILNSFSFMEDVPDEDIEVLKHKEFSRNKPLKATILDIMAKKKKEYLEGN